MMHNLISYLVASLAVVTTSGQLTSGISSSANTSCCPAGSIVADNGCVFYESPGQYFICEPNDIYDPKMNICINSYAFVKGTLCKDGYAIETNADDLQICIKRYDAKPSICPEGFVLNSQRMCEKIVDNRCPSPEPSPMHPYTPLPSERGTDIPSATPCLRICPASNQTFMDSAGFYSKWMQSQFLNGSCFYNIPVGSYANCDAKGEYHPETNSCWYYYGVTADNYCEPGYKTINYNGNDICLREIGLIYTACPVDYTLVEYMGQRLCVKKVDAVCVEDAASPYSLTPKPSPAASQTPKQAECSESPSQTPKVVERSESPSMTAKVAERTMSPSQTPKVVERSESPSQTPKVAERSESPSQTPKQAERTMSSSQTPKVAERSESPSQTPKQAERTMSPSQTPKVVERSESPSQTPKVAERSESPSQTPKQAERTMSPSQTAKVVGRSESPSQTAKVAERTMSLSVRPSNVDVLDYSNRPIEPLYTRKPDCNAWVCPLEYEVTNVDRKVVCKYYKTADYNIVALPSDPEGNVGYYNDYYCPTGTKLTVIQGAVESKKYWCEGYTDARWIACYTQSPRIRTPLGFPSSIYKTVIPRTGGPSRRPIFYQSTLEFNGAIIDALIDPKVIKKLIIGLSCSVNDFPSTIKIKEICKKGNVTECVAFVIPQIDNLLIDCKKMYPLSASPSVAIILPPHLGRALQIDSTVQVKYEYTPVNADVAPASININDSPVIAEVALDISLTDSPSTVVAYSMTQGTAVTTAENDGAAAVNGNDDSAVSNASRNAIVGIVVGCVAIGAILVGGLMAHRIIKRNRREKLIGTTVTKNPAVVDMVSGTNNTRWAFAPQTV